MFEDFINAFQNFVRNKVRTFLSLLGVIIGVASVIVITSMGASSTNKIKGTFGNSGLDVVQMSKGWMMRGNRASSSVIQFNESFREELFGQIRGIKSIWFKNSFSPTLAYEDLSASASCGAIETGYLEMYNFELESGNFFSVTDNEEGAQKIILNHDTAESLFPKGDAVGQMITLVQGKITFGFKVIGVLKEQNTGMENSAAYVPRGWYAKKIKPNPTADNILVQAMNESQATDLAERIKTWCTEKADSDLAVNVTSMQSMIEQMSEITNTLSLMLAAIAAISLLVGGIGIMNIMIVTVTERKQEIGIRKALGASPFDIKRQFLVESASITLMGGLLGVILGVVISLAVEYIKSEEFIINWEACLISFVFSVVVGIFFGYNPASRAAKLDPVVALSGE
ncbi:MAG: ABC transporter permease [Treponema sp.]|nr:ABC transporter permease [Treponema sp.]